MPHSDDDDVIEQIAAGQLGLVTRAQLRARNHAACDRGARADQATAAAAPRRVSRGARGGAARARVGRSACLWSAGRSESAQPGWLWQLLPDPGDVPVDITQRKGERGRRPNIRRHRVSLSAKDVTIRDAVPVTTPLRTVLDLAAVLDHRDLEKVLARVEREGLLDQRDLQSLTTKRAGRPGAPILRELLESEGKPALTRSEAEERLLMLIRKAQLPAPETNVQVGAYEVDFFWRRERLVVEVDGYAFHTLRRKFENDRRRDAWLAAEGVRVMRVTWRQLTDEPEAMLVRLAQTLIRA